jgi:hypothetical protein
MWRSSGTLDGTKVEFNNCLRVVCKKDDLHAIAVAIRRVNRSLLVVCKSLFARCDGQHGGIKVKVGEKPRFKPSRHLATRDQSRLDSPPPSAFASTSPLGTL